MSTFRLVRTALPVGQGAFYCERFVDTASKDKVRNIVYDCGALDNKRQMPVSLTKDINGLLDKGEHIDVLFVSHFDADHVNGIAQLNQRNPIDRIVLPELDKNDIWFLYALGAVNGQIAEMADFANFFTSYQGQILNVSSIDEEANSQENDGFFTLDGDNEAEAPRGTRTIGSGTKIRFANQNLPFYWIYVPMNYGISPKKLQALKKNIFNITKDGKKLSEDDLKDASKVGGVTAEIKKAFENSGVDTNLTSMAVYSGPSLPYKVMEGKFDSRWWFNPHTSPYYWHWHYYDYYSRATACLYTGDSILNDKRCKSIFGYINSIKDNIGTLQIPHHGSSGNFNCDVFENEFQSRKLENIFCFASYGVDNIFRHPSSKVTMDLILHGTHLWGVIEEKHSQFYECIYIDF